jgi:hypothetical protein
MVASVLSCEFSPPVRAQQTAIGDGTPLPCPIGTANVGVTGIFQPNCTITNNGVGPLPLPSPGQQCGIGTAFVTCGYGTDGLEAAAEAIAGMAHFWPLSAGTPGPGPTTCPSTLPDDINNGFFATASPNPLAVTVETSPSPGPSSLPLCYAPPIVGGPNATYGTSVYWTGLNFSSIYGFLSIPEAALPTSGPFTVGCVIAPQQNAIGSFFVIAQDAPTHFELAEGTAGGYVQATLNGTAVQAIPGVDNAALVVYTWDGTNSLLYYNGPLVQWQSTAPAYSDATGGLIGSIGNFFQGRIQDCFEANVAITPAQEWTLAIGAGL